MAFLSSRIIPHWRCIERRNRDRAVCRARYTKEIPGDFIETGVWRGGCCILMRGILAANGVTDRRVYVADSFAGLPPPDAERYAADAGDPHHTFKELSISIEQVRENFARYGLLDDQV